MSQKENELTRRLKREVEDIGGSLIVIHGGRYSSGNPDRCLYHRAWTGLVEIKTRAYKLSKLQRMKIGQLRSHDPSRCYVLRLKLVEGGGRVRTLRITVEDENGDVLAICSGTQDFIAWARDTYMSYHALRDSDLS